MKGDKIIQLFFYQPMTKFGVRELSRLTFLDTKTIMKYLHILVAKKIILRNEQKRHFTTYEANRLSPLYKFEKSHALVRKIYESGLLEYLQQKIKPKNITLFGSVAKGTYHEKSDIDIFIQSSYQRVNVSRYEQKLGHKVSLFFEENLDELSKALKENIFNGDILAGKLEVPT